MARSRRFSGLWHGILGPCMSALSSLIALAVLCQSLRSVGEPAFVPAVLFCTRPPLSANCAALHRCPAVRTSNLCLTRHCGRSGSRHRPGACPCRFAPKDLQSLPGFARSPMSSPLCNPIAFSPRPEVCCFRSGQTKIRVQHWPVAPARTRLHSLMNGNVDVSQERSRHDA